MRNRTIISNSDNACNVCVVCVMNGIQDSAYSVNGGDDSYNNDDDGPRTVGANGWKFEKKMRKSWRRGVRQLNERDFVKRTTRCTISSIRSDPRGVWRRLWCSEDEWHIVKNVHNSICSCNPLFFASFSLVQRFTWLAGWLLLPSLSRIQTSACWRDFEHRHTHTIFIFITFSFCRLHCALSIALLHVFLFCWLVCVPLQSGILVLCNEANRTYTTDYANGMAFFFLLSPPICRNVSLNIRLYCMLTCVSVSEVGTWIFFLDHFENLNPVHRMSCMHFVQKHVAHHSQRLLSKRRSRK